MQWGLIGVNVGIFAQPEQAVSLATAAEAAGFDSLWTFEHVVVPLQYQSRYPYSPSGTAPGLENAAMSDPLVWLAYVAAGTTTIALGTGVLILPLRNPVVLAKEVASLDALSGGRVRLGVGVGWLEEEYHAVGVPFTRRGARVDDSIAAMRALWNSDDASHHSEFTSFSNVRARPRPAGGAVHVAIGGHSETAARRAGRLGDGWFAAIDAASIAALGLPGALERFVGLIEVMRRTAEDHVRDPDAIEVSLLTGLVPPTDAVERLEAYGVHRMVLFVPTADPVAVEPAIFGLAQRVGLR
jgi:probable F420-dependent oxidoreductase